jgi:hypothetical protein
MQSLAVTLVRATESVIAIQNFAQLFFSLQRGMGEGERVGEGEREREKGGEGAICKLFLPSSLFSCQRPTWDLLI